MFVLAPGIIYDPGRDAAYPEMERQVRELWVQRPWRGAKFDDALQYRVMEAMRARYVFPDVLSLIGDPDPSDYDRGGDLTLIRKADFLLLGTFAWQGMILSRHPCVFGYNFRGYQRWKPDDVGWHVALEAPRFFSPYQEFFVPFQHTRTMPLLHYLANDLIRPLQERETVLPIDGNPFNAHPDNLRIVSTRGRPMRCKTCKRRVLPEHSKRFKVDGVSQRHCITCLETRASRREVTQLW